MPGPFSPLSVVTATPPFFDRNPEVITLPTGHCSNWSRPDLVADLLLGRAKKMPLI
jgi:hypothetical protein